LKSLFFENCSCVLHKLDSEFGEFGSKGLDFCLLSLELDLRSSQFGPAGDPFSEPLLLNNLVLGHLIEPGLFKPGSDLLSFEHDLVQGVHDGLLALGIAAADGLLVELLGLDLKGLSQGFELVHLLKLSLLGLVEERLDSCVLVALLEEDGLGLLDDEVQFGHLLLVVALAVLHGPLEL
jgi:hypothetical protein